ncbi:MAG: mannose-1-phosphate guanylyltransferase [Rikenellaceae bacterium]
MSVNRYCIIMAGSFGTRFWPQSRQSMPKQFLDILGVGKSFIRQTFERLEPQVPLSNFRVVTNSRYKDLVLEQIPELSAEQVLCEPISRNTAPCIAYAAYSIAQLNPNAELIVTPSDHYITGDELFRAAIEECIEFAKARDILMTIGVRAQRPESGYGYIQLAGQGAVSRVKCFVEKPTLQLSEAFVQSGDFLWNTGVFVCGVSTLIDAYIKYLPEHHYAFKKISSYYGTELEEEAINRVFSECKSISIDYGIMEKADNVYVKTGEFSWCDVGSWSSLFSHVEQDSNGNLVSEESCLYNTSGSIISVPKGKVVVVSGLEDFLVVDTEDVLMICPRSEEPNIKGFVEDIKYRVGDKHL